MHNTMVRVAVGATGALLALIGIVAWADPARVAAKLGVQAANGLGLATLRADLGAFFVVGGSFALLAALRRSPTTLNAPLLLIAFALAGRFLALALTPFDVSMVPPMVAEAMIVAVFAAGRFMRATP